MKQITLIFIGILLSFTVLAQGKVDKKDIISNIGGIADEQNIDSLQKANEQLRNRIENLKIEKESLIQRIQNTKDSIGILKRQIQHFEAKLLFADTVIARISNDCLRLKYDSLRVEEAIRNFRNMYSETLQKRYKNLETLLMSYGRYTRELEVVLHEIQEDTKLQDIFLYQEAAEDCIVKIKKTEYYREIYNANWTIPYLNDVIDEAIKRIRTFNPKNNSKVKLLELVD